MVSFSARVMVVLTEILKVDVIYSYSSIQIFFLDRQVSLLIIIFFPEQVYHLFINLLQIFAGAFPENYEPPSGFYFEVNADSPVVQVTSQEIES